MADTEAEIEKRLNEEENDFVDQEIDRVRQAAKARGIKPRIYLFGLLTEAVSLAIALGDLGWLDEVYRTITKEVRDKRG